ncbi:hypothetical protein PAECIP111891_06968 [Paenibacillus allorhizoplanae]|uniref:YxiJ-like protein n=1 Tax=Paenibacillus allorhizoplanae TaxID=2905648 RepID=A0ABN8H919_9BACL|nr:YxiJ-like family protein [Paenibacillus allorhizoplanae]CAH1232199.1 hypothetical protein PAECIP111891_06968 [Paenibacillus allorhizoplanae]
MDNEIQQLQSIQLRNPFPYRDMEKVQADFRSDFMRLPDSENFLIGDFNTYCMNVAGTLSYILAGNEEKIPQRQIELLQLAFFDWFPQYQFIKDRIWNYSDLSEEYTNFNEARIILIRHLSKLKP